MNSLGKNKKIILLGLGAMIAGVLLIVSNAFVSNRREQASRPEPIELEMWGIWDESEFMRTFTENFRKQYPNVTINYRKVSLTNYESDLIEALAEGRGPDIFATQNFWRPKHKNKISPLPEEVMTLREYQERFVDVVEKDYTDPTDNKIYGIPLYTDSLALFYNRDAFNDAGFVSPPSYWDELMNYSTELTFIAPDGQIQQAGVAMGTADNVNRPQDILSALMLQVGAQMNNPNNPSEATFTRSVNVDGVDLNPAATALEFYTDFANPRQSSYTWNSTLDYSTDAFIEREATMMFGYSYHVDIIRARNPRLNFAVAPLPQISEIGKANYANYWGYSVSIQSQHPKEAWQFLKFLTETENSQNYFLQTKRPTSRQDLIEVQRNDPEYGVFVDQLLQTKTWTQPDNGVVDATFQKMITDVNRGILTPEQAVTQAQREINLFAEGRQ
jgi:multiple sugar transport system substrate-binding protein